MSPPALAACHNEATGRLKEEKKDVAALPAIVSPEVSKKLRFCSLGYSFTLVSWPLLHWTLLRLTQDRQFQPSKFLGLSGVLKQPKCEGQPCSWYGDLTVEKAKGRSKWTKTDEHRKQSNDRQPVRTTLFPGYNERALVLQEHSIEEVCMQQD